MISETVGLYWSSSIYSLGDIVFLSAEQSDGKLQITGTRVSWNKTLIISVDRKSERM